MNVELLSGLIVWTNGLMLLCHVLFVLSHVFFHLLTMFFGDGHNFVNTIWDIIADVLIIDFQVIFGSLVAIYTYMCRDWLL